MSGSIAYRPDIDGLRAVAVVSVILCHFGVSGFAGGYVGVDIFFVISGFLITSIVLQDIVDGTYSTSQFYARRARRILPAFVAVAVASTLAALCLFLPADLLAFGRSLLASAVFSTNVLFWQEGGYFATSSELKPLLHTWSLSIEEQFYVVFPLLLGFASRRAPRRLTSFLSVLLAASLGLCIWATGRREFAFYILPSRAWELLTGAVLATAGPRFRFEPRVNGAIGIASVAAVASSILVYSNRTSFPGIAAVLPCLGAAGLVFSGADSGPARWLLSRRIPIFVGRISYSLYLWHWPLLVFYKYYSTRRPTGLHVVLLLATALVLSIVTWRFVETPFRRAAPQSRCRATVLHLAGLSLLSLAAIGGAIVLSRGWTSRVPKRVLAIAGAREERDRPRLGCIEQLRASRGLPVAGCTIGDLEFSPSFAIWGDSHASSVSGGVAVEARRVGQSGVVLSKTGCPALADTDIARGTGSYAACRQFTDSVLDYLEHEPPIRRVLLVSRWSLYVVGQIGTDTGTIADPDPYLLDPERRATTLEQRADLLRSSLHRTVDRLRRSGKEVFVSDPVPEVGWDVPMKLARLAWFHPDFQAGGWTIPEYVSRNFFALRIIADLANTGQIVRLSPQNLLCEATACRIRSGDEILYADGDHVSFSGALMIAPAFRPLFER